LPDRAQWTIAEPDARAVDGLVRSLGVGEIAARCLVNRGQSTVRTARAFLAPKLADLDSPEQMADLTRAAERVAAAIEAGEPIGVFGDYDVDGVTSAAVMLRFLAQVGVETRPLIADRFAGGFGLGVAAVERLGAAGCRSIVALDCGPGEPEVLRTAARLGIDVIVVDHHRVEAVSPELTAFVNPQREDCGFPDKSLAAVGLAFYFTAAIRATLVERGRLDRQSVDPRSLLDLVALGTVADVVPLRGNNRILVHHGLELLSRYQRPGLAALLRSARVRSSRVRADHIAFQLAPRLNAAGRMGSALDALELLTCDEPSQARRLAQKLERLTQERRTVEEQVARQARRQVDDQRLTELPAIVVGGDGWHRGVLGIVAARLTESYGKPAYVVGFDGEQGTGSARAQGQLNLHRSLAAAARHLVRFGGHRDAAGFTVDRGAFGELKRSLIEHAQSSAGSAEAPGVVCDARIGSADISDHLLTELDRLGPFGHRNPDPVFEVGELRVLDSRVVGGEHLKLELMIPGGTVSAFGPRMGRFAPQVPPVICVAAALTHDEWRGDGSPELKLIAPPIEI
jgi:single-stranded-DNA-specific exonuclease